MSELSYNDFRGFIEEAKKISGYPVIEGADWDAEIGALVLPVHRRVLREQRKVDARSAKPGDGRRVREREHVSGHAGPRAAERALPLTDASSPRARTGARSGRTFPPTSSRTRMRTSTPTRPTSTRTSPGPSRRTTRSCSCTTSAAGRRRSGRTSTSS